MPRRKHGHDVHKYVRVVFPNKTIWKCGLTNCSHYLVGEMVVGRLTLCNRCGKTMFEMKEAHLLFKKPHCLACTKRYKGKQAEEVDIASIAENLEKLLKVE